MAGNREIYDKAMRTGHSAAWDQNWDRAIAAYGRAIQEFPEDAEAHRSLGLALLQARRLEEALKVYMRAHQLAPDDPIPLEKSADVLERMGRLREAAQQYVKVAEIYIAQRDLDKSIGNWERATHLTPGLIPIHAKLATAYERIGVNKKAIREYLTLAFNFQRGGDTNRAIQAVQRALRLDRNHSQALNTLQALQSGSLVHAPETEDYASQSQKRMDAFDADFADKEREVGDSNPDGPLGEAEEVALGSLASHVFETGTLSPGTAFAIQAIELHRQGETAGAVGAYQQAMKAGLENNGIMLSIGALLLKKKDNNGAIKYLSQVSGDPTLEAGAAHGLGQAYYAQQNVQRAADYLIETLRQVDFQLAINNEERQQLAAVYNNLKASISNGDEAQLEAVNNRLLQLLVGHDWKQRVAETRRQLEELSRSEDSSSMIEQLAEGSEELTQTIARIDRYERDGLWRLAADEAHFAIELAPTYLPVHLRIAQILLKENQMQLALAKYKMVAETYMMREQTDRAATILNEALHVAPMDLSLRTSLLNLLRQEERWPEVLEQNIDMADAYYQLADFDKARETYLNAQRMAERIDADTEQITYILHRIADIDVTQMDLRQAIRTYEQIKAMNPGDERSRKALVDLNFRLNNRIEAIKELDQLMTVYARQRRPDLIGRVLEEQVQLYPQDMALRSRMASFYRQLGRQEDAVRELDTLGELQLNAGLREEAIKTIRQIVALNPPSIEDYTRLLSQLGG